nr:9277_t:CDS:2 [Entrophospora candida]
MGRHGRALEALEIAIKGKDLDNCNFAKLMNEICVRLVDRYSEWKSEFSKLGLVQFMNDEGETDQGRFALSLHMDLDNGEQVR